MARDKRIDDLAKRLMGFGLFAGMSHEEVADIVGRLGYRVRSVVKGEVIVHEGTRAKWVVLVLSGTVSVYESGANGERHLVRAIEPGDLFGATLVTKNLEYYPGMAVASKDSEVVFFEMAKLRAFWAEPRYSKLFWNLFTIVCSFVLFGWRKFSMMACKTTDDKFMLYLHWYASEVGSNAFTLPFARMENCARFLGVSRTALSPAIGRLVARGEIAHPGRGQFKVLRSLRPEGPIIRFGLKGL